MAPSASPHQQETKRPQYGPNKEKGRPMTCSFVVVVVVVVVAVFVSGAILVVTADGGAKVSSFKGGQDWFHHHPPPPPQRRIPAAASKRVWKESTHWWEEEEEEGSASQQRQEQQRQGQEEEELPMEDLWQWVKSRNLETRGDAKQEEEHGWDKKEDKGDSREEEEEEEEKRAVAQVNALLHPHHDEENLDSHKDSRPERPLGDPSMVGQHVSKIIGGWASQEGRFPYMVSLTFYNSIRACGGTLIAPDVVLTAAHCVGGINGAEIGRFNISQGEAHQEDFVLDAVAIHPRYQQGLQRDNAAAQTTTMIPDFTHDLALVKLLGHVSGHHDRDDDDEEEDRRRGRSPRRGGPRGRGRPYVRLNRNPRIPRWDGQHLTVLGWGHVERGVVSSIPDVLQQADVLYKSNEDCEASEGLLDGFYLSYEGLLHPSMLCATTRGGVGDTCQGDSGGPLLLLGDDDDDDVQVGVTSWGFGCGHPHFPGVYSRLSEEMEWIDETVCQMSENPPSDFRCQERTAQQQPPPPSSSSSSHSRGHLSLGGKDAEDGVEIIVEILLDDNPGEIGWILQSDDDKEKGALQKRRTYHYVPIGTYHSYEPFVMVQTRLHLDSNRRYRLSLMDQGGDGIQPAVGNHNDKDKDDWVLYRLRDAQRGGSTLVEGSLLDFRFSTWVSWHVTSSQHLVVEDPPWTVVSYVPFPSLPVSIRPVVPTDLDRTTVASCDGGFVTLVIQLDGKPAEVSWSVQQVSTQTDVVYRPPGYYPSWYQNRAVLETVCLGVEKEERFTFTIVDQGHNGLCCDYGDGYYLLFHGWPSVESLIGAKDRFRFFHVVSFSSLTQDQDQEDDDDNENGESAMANATSRAATTITTWLFQRWALVVGCGMLVLLCI